jgi:rhamnogalacturonan hydrolase
MVAPGDYLVIEQGENAEVYNLVLRGPFIGGIDGIDISGSNIWVHDVEVTNGDECVTVKVTMSSVNLSGCLCLLICFSEFCKPLLS